jgi:acyl-CoA thioester hydrolase
MYEHAIRIYWEDTDAGGIVFYANYLKFFERARTEWLRSLGVGQQVLKDSVGGMFVVTHTQMQFRRPARLDDQIMVTAALSERGNASLVIHQTARLMPPFSSPPPAGTAPDAALLCDGSIRIGWVNAITLKPGRIPAAILERLT